jgi:transposase
MRRHELTDEQWELIEDLFPENGHRRGGQCKEHRVDHRAMFWWLRTGVPWRDLPERYGPWKKTLYEHFNRWREDGTFERIIQRLQVHLDGEGKIDWDLWCVWMAPP